MNNQDPEHKTSSGGSMVCKKKVAAKAGASVGIASCTPNQKILSRRRDVKSQKSERIEVRTSTSTKSLLQHAAASSHQNVTEFLLDAGIRAAEEVLTDRRLFQLSDAQWQEFQEILDRPVRHKPNLARLLAEKTVLD